MTRAQFESAMDEVPDGTTHKVYVATKVCCPARKAHTMTGVDLDPTGTAWPDTFLATGDAAGMSAYRIAYMDTFVGALGEVRLDFLEERHAL